ncbi:hypothetical protein [Kribbella yunnanensis]
MAEDEHECLDDMYGAEDGMSLGDGYICERCGDYVMTGVSHGPETEEGFPRKHPIRPDPPGFVVYTVDEIFDLADRPGLLVSGRIGAGRIAPGMTLYTYQRTPVLILGIEFTPDRTRTTLLISRTDRRLVPPTSVLRS